MTFKTAVILVILFFVIRFFLRFLIPIIKVTRQAKQGIEDLKSQMESMQQQQYGADPFSTKAQSQPKPQATIDGEYIDYEEVK